ncbi:MAG: tetratricopeptide repeat protein, partial [Bryobacteraceae bacterium]
MQRQCGLALTAGVLFLRAVVAAPTWGERAQEADRAQQAGRYAEAAELFRALLEEAHTFPPGDPRLGRALNNLAAIEFHMGKYTEAEKLYRHARLSVDPAHDLPVTLNNLAALLRITGRYAEAESLYREAIATGGDMPAAWNNLAE